MAETEGRGIGLGAGGGAAVGGKEPDAEDGLEDDALAFC